MNPTRYPTVAPTTDCTSLVLSADDSRQELYRLFFEANNENVTDYGGGTWVNGSGSCDTSIDPASLGLTIARDVCFRSPVTYDFENGTVLTFTEFDNGFCFIAGSGRTIPTPGNVSVAVGRCSCKSVPIELPTPAPSPAPTINIPTYSPTTSLPTLSPTPATVSPTSTPTQAPTPRTFPGLVVSDLKVDFTNGVTFLITPAMTSEPTPSPTQAPSALPTLSPSLAPTYSPSLAPADDSSSMGPSASPSELYVTLSPTIMSTGDSSLPTTSTPTSESNAINTTNSPVSSTRVGALRHTTRSNSVSPTSTYSSQRVSALSSDYVSRQFSAYMRSSLVSEYNNVPFEIMIRCFFAHLLKLQLGTDESYDIGAALDDDDAIVDFMPEVSFSYKCVENLPTNGTSVQCPVTVGIRDFNRNEFTSSPTTSPTKFPTDRPSLAPTLLPTTLAPTDTSAPTTTETYSPTLSPATTFLPTIAPSLAPGETSAPTALDPNAQDSNFTGNFTASPSIISELSFSPTAVPSSQSGTTAVPSPSVSFTIEPTTSPVETPTVQAYDYTMQIVLADFFAGRSPVANTALDLFYTYYTGLWNFSADNIDDAPDISATSTTEVIYTDYIGSLSASKLAMLAWTIGECPNMLTLAELEAEDAASSAENGNSTPSIVGGVIGGGVGIGFIALTILLIRRRRRILRGGRGNSFSESGHELILRSSSKESPAYDKHDVQAMLKDLDIDDSKLEIGPTIGHGANGRIMKGVYCGSEVAIKEVFPEVFEWTHEMTRGGFGHPDLGEPVLDPHDQIWREVRNLRLLRHPNVIQLYGCSQRRSADSEQWRFFVIMELACCSLRDLLNDDVVDGFLPFTLESFDVMHKIVFMREIASGLAYIHDSNMIHFDIKPENILISNSGHAKICDLGIAKLYTGPNKTLNMTLSTMGGTPPYMAPELLRGVMDQVGTSVDVYAFGMVLWQVFHPQESPHPTHWSVAKLFHEVMISGYRPLIREDVPEPIATVIRECWRGEAYLRPSLHSLVKEFNSMVGENKQESPSRRSRFSSNENINMLQVHSHALAWEHSQRRYIPCEIKEKYADPILAKVVATDCLMRFHILLDAHEFFQGERTSQQIFIDFAESEQGGVAVEDRNPDINPDASGASSSLQALTSPSRPNGPLGRESFETEGVSEWMLERRDVPESSLRIIDKNEHVEEGSVFQSLAKLAAMHLRLVLGLNKEDYFMMATVARNMTHDTGNAVFINNNTKLTVEFEDDADAKMASVSGKSALWGKQGSFGSHFDSGKSDAMVVMPASTSSTPVSTSETNEKNHFDVDKMSFVKYARLYVNIGLQNYKSVYAALHLPTFSLVTVKDVCVADMAVANAGIEYMTLQWQKICQLLKPNVFPEGAETVSEARVATRVLEVCPQLVNMYGCYFDPLTQNVSVICEYMEGGSLQDVLDSDYHPPYTEEELAIYMMSSAAVPGNVFPPSGQWNSSSNMLDDETNSFNNEFPPSQQQPSSRVPSQDEELEEVDAQFKGRPDLTVGPRAICDEDQLRLIAKAVLKALEFLHGLNLVHGEVKPSHITFNTEGDVKLGGFGINICVWNPDYTFELNRPVSAMLAFSSPEQIQGYTMTRASDVWSFMMSMITVAIGHHPYWYILRAGRSRERVVPDLLKAFSKYSPIRLPAHASFPPPRLYPSPYEATCQFSEEFQDFLAQGLRFEPEDRPSVSALLKHPWIEKKNSASLLSNLELSLDEVGMRSMDEILEGIFRTMLQRITASLEYRRFLQRHPMATEQCLVLRTASIDRLAEQMDRSSDDVKNSLIYVADEVNVRVRRAIDVSGTSSQGPQQSIPRHRSSTSGDIPPLPPRPPSLRLDTVSTPPSQARPHYQALEDYLARRLNQGDRNNDYLEPSVRNTAEEGTSGVSQADESNGSPAVPPQSWKVKNYKASFNFRHSEDEDHGDLEDTVKTLQTQPYQSPTKALQQSIMPITSPLPSPAPLDLPPDNDSPLSMSSPTEPLTPPLPPKPDFLKTPPSSKSP